MNKLFIGLLIIAAGAGVFFVLTKKNKTATTAINKDWIIGKWQTQPPNPVIDTVFALYRYDFLKDGILLQSLQDSIPADTMHYEWNKLSQLVWKQNKEDTTSRVFKVVLLTPDTLQVRGADSLNLLFTKSK